MNDTETKKMDDDEHDEEPSYVQNIRKFSTVYSDGWVHNCITCGKMDCWVKSKFIKLGVDEHWYKTNSICWRKPVLDDIEELLDDASKIIKVDGSPEVRQLKGLLYDAPKIKMDDSTKMRQFKSLLLKRGEPI